jgi:alpha-methylacyl-CoA racemase
VTGPLNGISVVEFAGIGPAPFCGMMLADMGADVVRIERRAGVSAKSSRNHRFDVLARGRRSIALDLKKPGAREIALRLVERANALIEGFRPGVMERLGLGPDICLERNSKLVYGRMTGWGQNGPLAGAAGHDINYIALSGALHSIGLPGEPPIPPLNLVGDFGGGGMLLAFGVVCGLLEAQRSGKGQVIDAAMTDGSATLMSIIYGLKQSGRWTNQRGRNFLDGGAHFYSCYECADGKYVAIGAIEDEFFGILLDKCGLKGTDTAKQWDEENWPQLKGRLASLFKQKTRDEWCAILEGSDACFAPVLDLDEAPEHPHNQARKTFVNIDGVLQPAPAPRFGRTPPEVRSIAREPGADSEQILLELGYSSHEITRHRNDGSVYFHDEPSPR